MLVDDVRRSEVIKRSDCIFVMSEDGGRGGAPNMNIGHETFELKIRYAVMMRTEEDAEGKSIYIFSGPVGKSAKT